MGRNYQERGVKGSPDSWGPLIPSQRASWGHGQLLGQSRAMVPPLCGALSDGRDWHKDEHLPPNPHSRMLQKAYGITGSKESFILVQNIKIHAFFHNVHFHELWKTPL